ncbi:hypothetical protein T08_3092, partial [Trichinella sp. T8]
TERKVNAPVDTGPSPNSDERVNNPTEGAGERLVTRTSAQGSLCAGVEEAVHNLTTIVHDVRKRAHNLESSLAINAANTPRCSLMGSVDRIGSLSVLGCNSMWSCSNSAWSAPDARSSGACFQLSGWDNEKTVPTTTATGKDGRNFLGRMLIFSSSTRGRLQFSQAFLLSQIQSSSLDVYGFLVRRHLSLLCTLMSSALPSDQIRGYIQDSGDSGSAGRPAVKTKRSAWGSRWCGEFNSVGAPGQRGFPPSFSGGNSNGANACGCSLVTCAGSSRR